MKYLLQPELVAGGLVTITLLCLGFILSINGTGVFGAFGVLLAIASVATGAKTLAVALDNIDQDPGGHMDEPFACEKHGDVGCVACTRNVNLDNPGPRGREKMRPALQVLHEQPEDRDRMSRSEMLAEVERLQEALERARGEFARLESVELEDGAPVFTEALYGTIGKVNTRKVLVRLEALRAALDEEEK